MTGPAQILDSMSLVGAARSAITEHIRSSTTEEEVDEVATGTGTAENKCSRTSNALMSAVPDDVDVDADPHTSEEIEIVVAQIRRLIRTASLEFALRVGAVIIHHFYDGDTDAWRSRGPKTASFRRLAQHPALPLSAGSLYRCVAIFEMCERLKAASRWEHLGASHLRLVLGLPHQTQERILSMANSNRWTVKVLQQEVLKQRSSRVTLGGRRAEPVLMKSLRRVQRSLDEYSSLIHQTNHVSTLDVERYEAVIENVRRNLEQLASSISEKTQVNDNDA